ncbi:MAG: VWA domain-containing protein [Nocardioidaceae bacterium]|nr:VWA domain-containing protein [Nocardioidaceae bacterium]
MNETDEILLGFTRALRAAGVPLSHDRSATYLAAVAALDAGDPAAVRTAGRATLCGSREDQARHDAVFAAWFGGSSPRDSQPAAASVTSAPLSGEGEGGSEDLAVAASEVEVLRERDVATMTEAERARLDGLLRTLRPRPPVRRTARRTTWRRGEIDLHRTLRTWLRHHGEPVGVRHRRRGTRPRRVVLLVDVSASMRPYADALLRLAHLLVRAPGSRVEVFTLGTRLTRVTAALRTADPQRALADAGRHVPDWAGGTRLGETLRSFVAGWQSLARGAVVVVLSDGWERGSTDDLADQTARLHRLAHRVVWVNPHRGKEGYEPVQRGIVAVLPHVDDLVAGHSVAAFAEVLEVVGRA